jgi:regulator of protease activity HflC (stomatin/prohibitin superfamily)
MGYRMEGSERSGSPLKIVGLVATGIIGVIVLTIGLSSFDKVDATEHCVKTRWGRVITPKVENGLTSTVAADLTCFPLTQQQFPGGTVTGEEASAETVEFLTRDSIMMSAEIALNWKYANVDSAFTTRRSHQAVLSEMANAVRSGARDAGATIGLRDLMGANRAGLDEVFRKAINMQMSDYALIEKVYIRKVQIPANIQQLWTQTIAMTAEQTKARAQFLTDSLNARSIIIKAEADARKTELETRALATSPEVLRLRTAEAMAKGLGEICKGVQTCIVGGSVMDTWKTPLPR